MYFADKKITNISVEEIISEFADENIETRRLWKPMHMQPIFKKTYFMAKVFQIFCLKMEFVYPREQY